MTATNGIPTKTQIIKDVVDAMGLDLSQTYDTDKVLTAANSRMKAVGGPDINRTNVHQTVQKMRQAASIKAPQPPMSPKMTGHERRPAKAKTRTAPKIATPPPQSFTHDELIAARKLLSLSGDSLLRAKGALTLVADLTLVKE